MLYRSSLNNIVTGLVLLCCGGKSVYHYRYKLKHVTPTGSPWKLEKAKTLGAIDGVDYKSPTWDKDLIQKAGRFDVVIDG